MTDDDMVTRQIQSEFTAKDAAPPCSVRHCLELLEEDRGSKGAWQEMEKHAEARSQPSYSEGRGHAPAERKSGKLSASTQVDQTSSVKPGTATGGKTPGPGLSSFGKISSLDEFISHCQENSRPV